jgi:hypothetical protein
MPIVVVLTIVMLSVVMLIVVMVRVLVPLKNLTGLKTLQETTHSSLFNPSHIDDEK